MPSGQSPIDIVRADVEVRADVPRLEVHYPVDAVSVDLGSTVLDGDETPEGTVIVPQIVGVPAPGAHVMLADVRFDLQSFHWHTPSEHLVDGERFPLELHLVHASQDGDLLVLGVLSAEGPADAAIAPAFAVIPSLELAHPDTRSVEVPLRRLLPQDTTAYQYVGSLTSAPFTSGVRWFVCTETRTASQEQIDAHTTLVTAPIRGYEARPRLGGNARAVQAPGDRVITLPDDAHDR